MGADTVEGMVEIEVVSSLDGSAEPSLLYWPRCGGKRPLLVGLHTWSCDRLNQVETMLGRCREREWGLLLPEFRGPNLVSNARAQQACASRLAMQDIVDAVAHVQRVCEVDAGAILLLGGSGGGHMALMMAGYAPQLWRSVSSWVPITDLSAWHGQSANYAPHIAACCGGLPGSSPAVDREYRARSPISHVEAIRKARVSVHHGRFDTSVPYTHTVRFALAMEEAPCDRFFFEVFDGGHELRPDAAFGELDVALSAGACAGALSR